MGLNPAYMQDVFRFRNDIGYSLRSGDTLERGRVRSVRNGLQTATHIGAQLWHRLDASLRTASSLDAFCSGVNSLSVLKCSCRICACYVQNVGFIN